MKYRKCSHHFCLGFNKTQYWFKARKHFTFIALEQSLDKARDRIRDKDINHVSKTEVYYTVTKSESETETGPEKETNKRK